MTWRQAAAVVIHDVIDASPGVTGPALMDLLRATCPVAEDAHYLRKLWRKEVQVALGIAQRRTPTRTE